MAVINFYNSANMALLTPFPGTMTEASANWITITNGNYNSSYGGSFSYIGNDVYGTMTSYIEGYTGGSVTVSITGLSLDAHSVAAYVAAGQVQSVLAAGLRGNDIIYGSAFNDILLAYDGNDVIAPGAGVNTVDGGAGFDTVVLHASIFGATGGYTTNGFYQVNSSESTSQFINVERIQYSDGVVALDTQGNAGNAYRLYQAAFNRTPDKAGLSFWTHALDLGTDIFAVAQGFVNAGEFKAVYGTNPTNAHIVDLMYQNILGRAGEPAGINFWVGQMNNGLSTGALLEGFAKSSENHGIVDPVIAQGIVLDTAAFLV